MLGHSDCDSRFGFSNDSQKDSDGFFGCGRSSLIPARFSVEVVEEVVKQHLSREVRWVETKETVAPGCVEELVDGIFVDEFSKPGPSVVEMLEKIGLLCYNFGKSSFNLCC